MGTSDQKLYARLGLIVKLLKQVSSLDAVSTFLKAHNAPHSISNWETLLEKRLWPAVKQYQITEAEVIQLLADAEEHGRHHVFLYRAVRSELAKLLDHASATRWAAGHGLQLGVSRVEELPDLPTVCSVRFDAGAGGQDLVVKVVEKREYKDFLGEETKNDILTKRWRIERERAVNVARLRADGLLELRIRSQKNTSKYAEPLKVFWVLLQGLFPQHAFRQFALQKVKTSLYDNKDKLSKEIRFSDSKLRNDNGVTLIAAAGRENQSLFADPGALKGVEAFLSQEGYCDETDLWWIEQKSGVPSRDTHVLLAGDEHEFAVTAACLKADYEFVLERILRHAK